MKIFSHITSLALCLLLLAASALAQTATTGEISGTATDSTGAVVPGMTVTVSGPNLIRTQTTTTDDQGHYRFPNLPPGKCTITVEAGKGFAKMIQENVEVNLSKTTSVEIKLQAAGTAASVEVVASASAAIDVTNNTTGTNVSTDQFSNFPTQRTVQSLYTIAPTAARSGLRDSSGRDRDPSVAGSSGPENNYILDGVTTSDPAFGGSGANLPFEFVQEVEIKTGAYSAEYGKATGGIFNVITKSGGNEFHGDAFVFGTAKSFVRETRSFPFTGSAPNGFSEVDAGFDIGGPIKKDKLWFFGAFNPQHRQNNFLTQTFRQNVSNKINTPFYAGKITYAANQNHILTFSTFGDYTTQKGFLFGGSGFGATQDSFNGRTETGGSNYTWRLNSTFSPNWIGEFAFGLHRQRANTIPLDSVTNVPLITDNFAILKADGTVASVTQSGVLGGASTGFVDYVNAPGKLQRNYVRQGFGLFSDQDRNRMEFSARLQNNFGRHTIKYGFEYNRNSYIIDQASSGPSNTFANPLNLPFTNGSDVNQVNGYRITNNFSVCTTRTISGAKTIVCPSSAAAANAALIATAAGYSGGAIVGSITTDEVNNNPFLVRSSTRVRDFQLHANTHSDVQSFYVQDEFKLTRNFQINAGFRWDFQQAYGQDGAYLKLNNFWHDMQPRVGLIWDFTGKGRGKVYANYATFLETPVPLDLNVRAGSDSAQTDKNFNVNQLNAPTGATIVSGFTPVNLGSSHTPIDLGLRPQTVNETTAGIEYEVKPGFTIGFRGIYRAQGNVIEDGSFDDGDHYFLFNPGRRGNGETTEDKACSDPTIGCFGRARRYYRALEFTATKRFTKNYQMIASYVYSSLIGNYEGLFRNDNGQSDPNITSLFDLVSLLNNTYGRLPNDRPHQFKLDGSYQLPHGLMLSASFRAQSGIPENQLIPHAVYGNNEGFGVPRGSVGRTPTTTGLDIGVYYPIKFKESKELRFQFDWFNVYNSQRAVRVDDTYSINSGVSGVSPIPNPFYQTGTIFQFPSAMRLGAKFRF